jgi:4-diphosphocytidyl-2-C-methyl-D-erythritol kinase
VTNLPKNRAPESITLKAPAKINLYLAITGKRADGYHDIETLMQKIDLADRIQLRVGNSGIRLTCPGIDLPTDESNLAYRAAVSFLRAAGPRGVSHVRQGVDIVLEKKIPVAAGLGGGSSNAATMLRGMNILFAAGLSDDELLALAKPLGADVPFFIHDWPAAWATGIGVELTPTAPLTNYYIVLVNPGIPVSTAWVYRNFTLTSAGNPFILARGRASADGRSPWRPTVPEDLYNDLETVTIPQFPEIGLIKNELRQDGADGVLMSGSGPTVFGLFRDKVRADRSYARFVKKYRDKVFMTRPHQSEMSY